MHRAGASSSLRALWAALSSPAGGGGATPVALPLPSMDCACDGLEVLPIADGEMGTVFELREVDSASLALKLSQRRVKMSIVPAPRPLLPPASAGAGAGLDSCYTTKHVVDSVCPYEAHVHALLWQLLSYCGAERHVVRPFGCVQLRAFPWHKLPQAEECGAVALVPTAMALERLQGETFAAFIQRGLRDAAGTAGGSSDGPSTFEHRFRAVVFQVLFTLHAASLLSGGTYRHNDAHARNCMVEPLASAVNLPYCVYRPDAASNGLVRSWFEVPADVRAVLIDAGFAAFVPGAPAATGPAASSPLPTSKPAPCGWADGRFPDDHMAAQGMSATVKGQAYDVMLFLTDTVTHITQSSRRAMSGAAGRSGPPAPSLPLPPVLQQFVAWVAELKAASAALEFYRPKGSCTGRLQLDSQRLAELQFSAHVVLHGDFFKPLRVPAPRGGGVPVPAGALDPLTGLDGLVCAPALPGLALHTAQVAGEGRGDSQVAFFNVVRASLRARPVVDNEDMPPRPPLPPPAPWVPVERCGSSDTFVRMSYAAVPPSVLNACWWNKVPPPPPARVQEATRKRKRQGDGAAASSSSSVKCTSSN